MPELHVGHSLRSLNDAIAVEVFPRLSSFGFSIFFFILDGGLYFAA